MSETAPSHVLDLIRDGRKIEAIKVVREETGASLKAALRAVEHIERGGRSLALDLDADPMREVGALAREGRTVEAIVLLRKRTGLGLKEAKDVVDACPGPDPVARSPQLALAVLVALLAVGAALAVLIFAA